MNRRFDPVRFLPVLVALLTLAALSTLLLGTAASQPTTAELRMPQYDDNGRLLLPDDWRRWVFVGASLGLSYSEGTAGMEMFHETLMEPSAYDHFTRTGEFRDGTMLMLVLQGTGETVLPQRQGTFAGGVMGLEMAVKDSRARDTWSYYAFGGRGGLRSEAAAIAPDACNDCHVEHAAHDNVFVQFYPLLVETAPPGTRFVSTAGAESTFDRPEPESDERLALDGLDPVLLIEGQAELGKPEIIAEHDGWTYRFISEPTRSRFAAEPEHYAIQNDSCIVIPGAPIDPGLFAVHEGHLYAFATQNCLDQFRAEPERYLAPADAG